MEGFAHCADSTWRVQGIVRRGYLKPRSPVLTIFRRPGPFAPGQNDGLVHWTAAAYNNALNRTRDMPMPLVIQSVRVVQDVESKLAPCAKTAWFWQDDH